ncbi:hypothetical protein OHA21_48135 [Actinoplanes sp. NBC_00393]
MPEAPTREGRPDSEAEAWDTEERYAEAAAAPAEDSAPVTVATAGDSVSYDDDTILADQAGAAPAVTVDDDEVERARAAGARDTATHLGDSRDAVPSAAADSAQSDSTSQFAPPATAEDYQRASSTIDAARSAEPEDRSWRRPAEAAAETPDPTVDEFGEPDDDDPDDEPLPQSVRPADAVLIARLDLEVLVVDGRPRYHMADCPHLVGRLTEALPVNEAVELGFSPCGLCRPVDRLVATVAHR